MTDKQGPKAPAPVHRQTTEVMVGDRLGLDALSRARTAEPALIVMHGDLPGEVFRLPPGRQLIGRRPECEIRVREKAVSGIHAEVIRGREGVTINDLASTNGTLVNGLPVSAAVVLTEGSLVRIGNCVFKYVDSLLDVEFLESLHSRGITDQLTNTYNHAYMAARLAFALDSSTAERPLSLIAFDFDDFKQVNDNYGHAAGDHVLRESCAIIRANVIRDDDLFARMGGEEFAIALPATSCAEAAEIAERIRTLIAEHPFLYNDHEIRSTVSFGVCTAASPFDKPESFLSRADELLYRSKHDGRNRVTSME